MYTPVEIIIVSTQMFSSGCISERNRYIFQINQAIRQDIQPNFITIVLYNHYMDISNICMHLAYYWAPS